MSLFLALQSTYKDYQLGLYSISSGEALDVTYHDKQLTSKNLIPSIDALLKKHALSLTDLPFIAVNQGPGPFTSQRVIITTVNGIAFSHKVPLVGIDSLKALISEAHDNTQPFTVALLNAYNKDVHYILEDQNLIKKEGCCHYDQLIKQVKAMSNAQIRFIGNGALLYQAELTEAFGEYAYFPDPFYEEASLDAIAKEALKKYKNNEITYQLSPIYLKSLAYKPLY